MIGKKRFRVISDVGVIDNSSGEIYRSHQNLCKLLNAVNDRADRNADELLEYKKLMMKYGINNIDKLDQVLFNQRIW